MQWLRDHGPEAWQRNSCILTPKDLVNLPLTGERCMDWTDADCSFLIDPDSAQCSDKVFAALGLAQGTPVELAYMKAVKSGFDPLEILEPREISDQC